MKVSKTTTTKEGKTYNNYYIVCDNGVRIPIEVKLIKRQGKIINYYDLVKLDVIAEPYEK